MSENDEARCVSLPQASLQERVATLQQQLEAKQASVAGLDAQVFYIHALIAAKDGLSSTSAPQAPSMTAAGKLTSLSRGAFLCHT